MFTAENWRNFPRLRLVLPIRPMTSFFTNFYFFRTPNIALLLGGSIGSFCLRYFFVLRVTYLLLEFSGGLFEITFMSSEWIVHNDSRVLLRSLSKFRSRAQVTWMSIGYMVIKVSFKGGIARFEKGFPFGQIAQEEKFPKVNLVFRGSPQIGS